MDIENQDSGTGDIDFDAAFSEASAEPGTAPAPAAPAPAPAEPAAAPAPAPEPTNEPAPAADPAAAAAAIEAAAAGTPQAAANPPAAGTPAPAGAPPAAGTPPAGTPPAAEPAPAPQQIDPRFLAQALAEEQQRLAQAAKPAEPAPAPAKPLTAADFLNATDNAAIEKFKTEWPDEHVAIQKLFQAEVQAHVGNALAQQSQQFNAILAPLIAQANRAEVNSHEGAIIAAHPDANTIAPQVVEWIKTQPALYQPMLNQVIQQGSAQQVVDLLTQYKTAIGQTSAAPVTPASSVPSSPAPAKPASPPAAAAALAAVPAAQRSKPAAGADPLDFDGAFEEASSMLAAS